MNIEMRKRTDLTPYDRNPRKNESAVEAVAASIQEFGFKVPIIVDRDGVIVAGHTRLKAAEKLGLEEVPVIEADDLTEEQVKAFRLADNKTQELAGWDFEMLDEELAEISGIDMAAFGFDPQEAEQDDGEIIEDEPPEPPEKPKTKLGDMFRLGDHTLLCGDATSKEDVQRLTSGAQIDLLLTDPPYNVDIGSTFHPNSPHFGEGILNDNMPEDEFVEFLEQAFATAISTMRPGAAFYIWYGSLHPEFFTAINKTDKMHISEQLIWVKSHFVMGGFDYHWAHEPCLYGWKEGAGHYFTNSRNQSTAIEEPDAKLSTMKKDELIALIQKLRGQDGEPTTVVRAAKPNAADLHPTSKPQNVLAPLIRNSSKPGQNVLDTFGGSGSTLIACEQLNRRCYMMELDPHYCDVIIKRWEEFTGKRAERISAQADEKK